MLNNRKGTLVEFLLEGTLQSPYVLSLDKEIIELFHLRVSIGLDLLEYYHYFLINRCEKLGFDGCVGIACLAIIRLHLKKVLNYNPILFSSYTRPQLEFMIESIHHPLVLLSLYPLNNRHPYNTPTHTLI